MRGLREKIEQFRSLPEPSAHGTGANYALHYLAKFGQLPDGWEMVFGVPRYTGTRTRRSRPLAKTAVMLPTLKTEETRSRNVNPEVRDISPVATPDDGGGTKKVRHPRFRANLTSGDRTKTHHDNPHQHCDTYDPTCRDREWETPVWIGGTDWVRDPLYRHSPPDARQVFAQDPSGQIPRDKPLPDVEEKHVFHFGVQEAIARFRALDSLDEAVTASSVGAYMAAPLGLISRSAANLARSSASHVSAWLDALRSSGTGPKSPPVQFLARRRRKRDIEDEKEPKIFKVNAKPGTPEHDAAMYRQAIELRRMVGKPFYIVDYKGRKVVTSRPQKHGKVLHVVEGKLAGRR